MSEPKARSGRVLGVDVARGLASVIMIQGHAYDGWASPEAKETAAYAFTRLLGSLPLPAFLVLAGAALTLRVEVAIRRGEPASRVRVGVARRGLMVLGAGYLSSFVYAAMDGHQGLPTLLRADVLHVIGLSIIAVAFLGIRQGREGTAPSATRLAWAAGALFVLPSALSPWASPLGSRVEGPLRHGVALFVDVPGQTLMPFVPLVSWVALGVLATLALRAFPRRGEGAGASAGAPKAVFIGLALGSVVVAFAGYHLMHSFLEHFGGELGRDHPAVWGNIVDLGARGLLVLAVGGLLTPLLGGALLAGITLLGRRSLWAYVFHIPFCYGALAAPFRDRLDMMTATGLLLVLVALSYLVAFARERIALARRGRA